MLRDIDFEFDPVPAVTITRYVYNNGEFHPDKRTYGGYHFQTGRKQRPLSESSIRRVLGLLAKYPPKNIHARIHAKYHNTPPTYGIDIWGFEIEANRCCLCSENYTPTYNRFDIAICDRCAAENDPNDPQFQ